MSKKTRLWLSCNHKSIICDALRNLVLLVQFKKRENTHGVVLLLVKLQALLKVTLIHECFSRFLNCTNGTKLRKASHIYPEEIFWGTVVFSVKAIPSPSLRRTIALETDKAKKVDLMRVTKEEKVNMMISWKRRSKYVISEQFSKVVELSPAILSINGIKFSLPVKCQTFNRAVATKK